MELYVERGFEQTTVAEIAQRAGLTARTFFRYFADKREVLFAGSVSLQEHIVSALDAASDSASPMEAVSAALDAAAAVLARAPRVLPAASVRHRRQRGAARARADQDGVTVRRPRLRFAPPRRFQTQTRIWQPKQGSPSSA